MQVAPSEPMLATLRDALQDDPEVLLAYAFGSLAGGRASFDSDADVAVLAARPLDAEHRRALIRVVAEVTGRPVDLVDLREAGMPLLRIILTEERELFCRDRREKDRIIAKMLTDVEDFLPLRRRMLKERRERWIH
jgi:predicted nucleotidyltransferase